jgi:hypothetical protein
VWRWQPSTVHESAPAPDQIGRRGGKGEMLWAHTYPTVSSRPRGRRVQSLVPIGSEMWICMRYKQTYKHLSLYIRLYSFILFCFALFLFDVTLFYFSISLFIYFILYCSLLYTLIYFHQTLFCATILCFRVWYFLFIIVVLFYYTTYI